MHQMNASRFTYPQTCTLVRESQLRRGHKPPAVAVAMLNGLCTALSERHCLRFSLIRVNPADKHDMEIAAAAALRGLQQAQARLNTVTGQIANPDNPADSIDLSTQAVALIQSRDDFAANISVLKTVDEMQKSVFDLTG